MNFIHSFIKDDDQLWAENSIESEVKDGGLFINI